MSTEQRKALHEVRAAINSRAAKINAILNTSGQLAATEDGGLQARRTMRAALEECEEMRRAANRLLAGFALRFRHNGEYF